MNLKHVYTHFTRASLYFFLISDPIADKFHLTTQGSQVYLHLGKRSPVHDQTPQENLITR